MITANSPNQDQLASTLNDRWKEFKKENSDTAKNSLGKYVDGYIKTHLNTLRSRMSKQIDTCVCTGIERLKKACVQVVKDSNAIGEEERRFLSQHIMDSPVPDWYAPKFSSDDLPVVSFHLLFWKLNFFDKNECAKNVTQKIDDVVGKGNQAYGEKLQTQLTQWKEAFVSNLTLKLADFNDELKDKRAKLEETRDEVERLTDAKTGMERKLEDIHQLFHFSAEKE